MPQQRSSNERYAAIAIGLHWAIAFLLIGNILLAWNMEDENHVPVESLFQLHKSIGITVLVLTIARIIWRFMNPPPPLPDDMAPHEKFASHLVHMGFYFAMLVLPLSGWALVSVSKFNVSTVLFGSISWPHLPILPELTDASKEALFVPIEFVHSKLAWLVIILVGLHVAGALKHQFDGAGSVLKRMIPGIFGKTDTPSRSRGAWTTFGASFGLFAAVAFLPSFLSSSPASSTITLTGDANWAVNYELSEIKFKGTHTGKEFTGVFTNWSTNILFDKSQLGASKVSVIIDPTSAKTGTKLYDDTIRIAEWFNVAAFPEISVNLKSFEKAEEGFRALAVIDMKDVSLEQAFPFQLSESDDGTMMTGQLSLDRSALNLGLSSDPKHQWVSQMIDVEVKVVAKPTGQ